MQFSNSSNNDLKWLSNDPDTRETELCDREKLKYICLVEQLEDTLKDFWRLKLIQKGDWNTDISTCWKEKSCVWIAGDLSKWLSTPQAFDGNN